MPRVMLALGTGTVLVALAGCASVIETPDTVARGAVEDGRCSGPQSLICAFVNSPVRVDGDAVILPGREFQFFHTAHELTFIDSQGAEWIAPTETLTDGASIPPMFVSLVGAPTSREFVNAAAVHDAYCGIGNETGPKYQQAHWEDVHRMFYEALIGGGTPRAKAGIMYSAVWLGGPRWNIPVSRNLNTVPTSSKQRALRRTIDFIEREEPNFEELHDYLWWEEKKMRRQHPVF